MKTRTECGTARRGAMMACLAVCAAIGTSCAAPKEGAAKKEETVAAKATPSAKKESPVAVIETSMGTIRFTMFPDKAPKACDNFIRLAESGYYNGTIFHRVIDNFMIQGGDPTGTGRGGRSADGVPFEDEFSPDLTHGRAGIVSMANAGPNTNGSQFFITLAPTPWLDNRHTIFGQVVDGMDVVKAIGAVKTGPGDKPAADVVMKRVSIQR